MAPPRAAPERETFHTAKKGQTGRFYNHHNGEPGRGGEKERRAAATAFSPWSPTHTHFFNKKAFFESNQDTRGGFGTREDKERGGGREGGGGLAMHISTIPKQRGKDGDWPRYEAHLGVCFSEERGPVNGVLVWLVALALSSSCDASSWPQSMLLRFGVLASQHPHAPATRIHPCRATPHVFV